MKPFMCAAASKALISGQTKIEEQISTEFRLLRLANGRMSTKLCRSTFNGLCTKAGIPVAPSKVKRASPRGPTESEASGESGGSSGDGLHTVLGVIKKWETLMQDFGASASGTAKHQVGHEMVPRLCSSLTEAVKQAMHDDKKHGRESSGQGGGQDQAQQGMMAQQLKKTKQQLEEAKQKVEEANQKTEEARCEREVQEVEKAASLQTLAAAEAQNVDTVVALESALKVALERVLQAEERATKITKQQAVQSEASATKEVAHAREMAKQQVAHREVLASKEAAHAAAVAGLQEENARELEQERDCRRRAEREGSSAVRVARSPGTTAVSLSGSINKELSESLFEPESGSVKSGAGSACGWLSACFPACYRQEQRHSGSGEPSSYHYLVSSPGVGEEGRGERGEQIADEAMANAYEEL
jgi:hypothetical protein